MYNTFIRKQVKWTGSCFNRTETEHPETKGLPSETAAKMHLLSASQGAWRGPGSCPQHRMGTG